MNYLMSHIRTLYHLVPCNTL